MSWPRHFQNDPTTSSARDGVAVDESESGADVHRRCGARDGAGGYTERALMGDDNAKTKSIRDSRVATTRLDASHDCNREPLPLSHVVIILVGLCTITKSNSPNCQLEC